MAHCCFWFVFAVGSCRLCLLGSAAPAVRHCNHQFRPRVPNSIEQILGSSAWPTETETGQNQGRHGAPYFSFGFLRFPSDSFGSLRFPSRCIGFLWFPSVSLGFHRFPSASFGFLQFKVLCMVLLEWFGECCRRRPGIQERRRGSSGKHKSASGPLQENP